MLCRVRGNTLRARCARSGIALGLGNFAERCIRLARKIILVRLLAPDQFGLMSIVMAVSMLFEAVADLGLKQAIIQSKKGAEQDYLNVTWWLQSIRGFALFTMAFLLAPLVSQFYKMPQLVPLLRTALIAIVINGLMSPKTHILQKNLRFGKWAFFTGGTHLLGTLLTLSLAFVIRNVWALVIGLVGEAIIRCLFSFCLCPFRPRLTLARQSLNSIIRFAGGMLGLPILTAITLQTDIIVLGKVVSTEKLGMYALALALSQQPIGLLSSIFGPVLLPAFSQKQDDKATLRNAVVEITTNAVLVGVPLTAFLIVYGRPILATVYGTQYCAMAGPFGLLCGSMLVRMHTVILAAMYLAVNRPHLHRRLVLVFTLVIVCCMYPGTILGGLVGAAAVLLIANVIMLSLQVMIMPRLIGLGSKEYLRCWLSSAWLLPIILLPAALLRYLEIRTTIANICVGGICCVLACLAGMFFWPRKQNLADTKILAK